MKPKINGKKLLKSLEDIQAILNRKTWNQMNESEKAICEISSKQLYDAYMRI
jgi:phage-related protein